MTRSCSRRARPAAAGGSGPALPVCSCPHPSVRRPRRRARRNAFRRPLASPSVAAPAAALVAAVEELCARGETGLVLLIEEPELFLRPQAQRYLHRLLRQLAGAGNQVLYSTHSPAFVDVGRLDELALVDWGPTYGTTIVQPESLPADASFRAFSELDAERSELLLAEAVLLVEGRTEKLTFPFVFRALGHDPDRLGISIVECGGKPNIVLFIRICEATRIPFVAVHDRDAVAGKRPIHGERVLNAQIAELARARAHRDPRARLRGDRRPPWPQPQAGAGARAVLDHRAGARTGRASARGRARRRAR